MGAMRHFKIDSVMDILKREMGQWSFPVVGVIAADTRDPFRVLISCLLSLRTQDKTTAAASNRLFDLASTPETMLKLTAPKIAKIIYPVCFYRMKARSIRSICRDLINRYEGRVPDRIEELLTLNGVGRKTANLVVTLGYRKPGICVDTHVHRITNRLGYVQTKTPDQTETALRAKLPTRYWMIINGLLVTYGQNLCRPQSPHCSRCKIERYCDKVGVTKSR